MLQALVGSDRAADFPSELGRSLRGLRVGVERQVHSGHADAIPEVAGRFDAAIDVLDHAGAVVREVELPLYEPCVSAVLVTMFADGFAEHAAQLREQWDTFGVSTRRTLAQGALLGAADHTIAQKVCRAVRRPVLDLYRDVDVIICATAIADAPQLEALDLNDLTAAIRTDYWSAVGNPVASVPIGFSDRGMPLGMQIAGRPCADATVLGVADAYQRLTDWHERVPPMVSQEHDRV